MAKKNPKERKKLIRKLRNKYRLVIINDATFDERFSAFLTPLNVIAGVALVFVIITAVVVSLVLFTPLKEYIPGYSDTNMRLNALNAALKADSLEEAQDQYQAYFVNLQHILNGTIGKDSTDVEGDGETKVYTGLDFSVSKEDSLLRAEIESKEQYALTTQNATSSAFLGLPGVLFFTPIRGTVTSSFNSAIGHLGVDVAAQEGEAIKAVYDGTVIMASFTSDGGNVIQIQHSNNLISIYKHNSALLKNVGDQVVAGESIAIIGNSGELTDGPHLHFELWYNGSPLDPQDFIAFSS
ncbi:M23 family metallopeptidase [Cryomorpha ignava]|uniref:M23 family metallopeptidase n=1 Tax=Cryomorpha ignava TaxID=101383 RepID=A0A7K3WV33_9FLAO|nr:M23 family metallopeptidase [Cryomorpha ignava]NEN24535.1 M23 family metallopeptidase [Cryomorpha ignava]